MFSPAWCPDAAVLPQSDAAREHPTSLRALALSADDNPAVLQSFPALQAVHIWGITLNERWLDALAELLNLTELRLTNVTVSASTLAGLGRLKGLRSLSVTHSMATSDEELVALGSLGDLERLDVRFTAAGAGTLAALIKLPRLREMWIGSTKIPSAALAKIPKLPALELLAAGSLPWTPKALAGIAMQPALRALDLSSVQKLEGPWWSAIAARGVLERIGLERAPVTSAQLSTLIGSVPLREVLLYPGEIQVRGAQGALRAKRNAVCAGNPLDFARHGRWLVCDHNNGKIAVWDSLTGNAQTLPSLRGDQPRAALTPDGSRVAVVTSLALNVLDLPSGKPVFSTQLQEAPSRLLFSDDGQLLAIGAASQVLVFDLAAAGARTPLAQGREPLSFEGGSLIMSTKERAICAFDLAKGHEIERWDPYVTARRAWLVGWHKPSFVVPSAPPAVFTDPMITQWVRTPDGFVAVATDARAIRANHARSGGAARSGEQHAPSSEALGRRPLARLALNSSWRFHAASLVR